MCKCVCAPAKIIQLNGSLHYSALMLFILFYFILFNFRVVRHIFSLSLHLYWLVELVKRMRNAGNTFIDGITVFNLIYSLLIVHSLSLRALSAPLSVMA